MVGKESIERARQIVAEVNEICAKKDITKPEASVEAGYTRSSYNNAMALLNGKKGPVPRVYKKPKTKTPSLKEVPLPSFEETKRTCFMFTGSVEELMKIAKAWW